VDGFHPATNVGELSSGGRLELWLSAANHIEMPPIRGWFGDAPPEERCDDLEEQVKPRCLEWYRDQSAYRAKMKALFTRMWRIAPNLLQEVEASTAYQSLTGAQQVAARQLKPSESPTAKFSIDATRNRISYEILVPWQAFPPVDRLNLERANLTFSVLQGGSVLATTDHTLADITRPALRSFGFVPPLLSHFTPCEYPLARWAETPVYAFLDASLNLRDDFTFHDLTQCCGAIMYPRMDAVSPQIVPVTRTVQRIGADEFVCSSPVAYRRGTSISHSSFVADLGPYYHRFGDGTASDELTVFRLPNGSLLVRPKPSWWLQEQSYTHCAACPWGKFAVYLITTNGEIKEALSLEPVRVDMGSLFGYDVEVSPDWRTVTEFRSGGEHWTSTRYCLKGGAYEQCGETSPSEPPKHGSFHL
jgi:hypothetical protein